MREGGNRAHECSPSTIAIAEVVLIGMDPISISDGYLHVHHAPAHRPSVAWVIAAVERHGNC